MPLKNNVIDALEGRELDKLVAAKVMGEAAPKGAWQTPDGDWAYEVADVPARTTYEYRWPPAYSKSMFPAWQVVDKFRFGHNAPGKDAVACVIHMTVYDSDHDGQDCECVIYSPCMAKVRAWGKDMPTAICRAALKAVKA